MASSPAAKPTAGGLAAGSLPSAPEQKKTIQEIFRANPLAPKTQWCLVSNRWWRTWKDFVGYDSAEALSSTPPPCIDNEDLLQTEVAGPAEPAEDGATPMETDAVVPPVGDGELGPASEEAPPSTPRPKPEGPQLRIDLRENLTHVAVPRAAWDQLVAWYGGGPMIERPAVAIGLQIPGTPGNAIVDLFPLRLRFLARSPAQQTRPDDHNTPGTGEELIVARIEKIHIMKYALASTFGYNPQGMRVMHGRVVTEGAERKWQIRILSREDLRFGWEDSGFQDGDFLMIDKGPAVSQVHDQRRLPAEFVDVPWPETPGGVKYPEGGMYAGPMYYAPPPVANEEGTPLQTGVTGLRNLGNTCFMNAALQCLSNVPELCHYFASEEYKADLNATNPLGSKGLLAKAFSALMSELWSGKFRVVAPREMKSQIGAFAQQFIGYQQHDSQELIAALLDGLHEDTNTVKDKPSVETFESDGSIVDEEVAAESWRRYQLRNKSRVVDLFQGMFKSTLICPNPGCGNVSVRFEPVMFLSVPLAAKTTMFVSVLVLPLPPALAPAGSRPVGAVTKTAIEAGVHATIAELKTLAGEKYGVAPEKLVAGRVEYGRLEEMHDWHGLSEHRTVALVEVDHAILPKKTRHAKQIRVGGSMYDKSYLRTVYAAALDNPDLMPPGLTMEQIVDVVGDDPSAAEAEPEPDPLEEVVTFGVVHRKLVNGNYHQLFGNPFVLSIKRRDLTFRNVRRRIIAYLGGCEVSPIDETNMPFQLNVTTQYGQSCRLCTDRGCRGCELPDRDDPIPDDGVVAVTWSAPGKWRGYDPAAVIVEKSAAGEAAPLLGVPLAVPLESFRQDEVLGEKDKWFCARCREHQCATKKLEVWSAPPILILHFKRFSFDMASGHRSKIDTPVDYPVEGLDLQPYLLSHPPVPACYDLTGVVLHHGSYGGGHYTAYARNHNDGGWYHFNDDSCKRVPADAVVSKDAYVLVYRSRDLPQPPKPEPPTVDMAEAARGTPASVADAHVNGAAAAADALDAGGSETMSNSTSDSNGLGSPRKRSRGGRHGRSRGKRRRMHEAGHAPSGDDEAALADSDISET